MLDLRDLALAILALATGCDWDILDQVSSGARSLYNIHGESIHNWTNSVPDLANLLEKLMDSKDLDCTSATKFLSHLFISSDIGDVGEETEGSCNGTDYVEVHQFLAGRLEVDLMIRDLFVPTLKILVEMGKIQKPPNLI